MKDDCGKTFYFTHFGFKEISHKQQEIIYAKNLLTHAKEWLKQDSPLQICAIGLVHTAWLIIDKLEKDNERR